MKKANSTEPAKYLPALQSISHIGASGVISFDEKGDRKDAEMTIFKMQGKKIEPIAIIKSGKSMTVAEYQSASASATAAPAAESQSGMNASGMGGAGGETKK